MLSGLAFSVAPLAHSFCCLRTLMCKIPVIYKNLLYCDLIYSLQCAVIASSRVIQTAQCHHLTMLTLLLWYHGTAIHCNLDDTGIIMFGVTILTQVPLALHNTTLLGIVGALLYFCFVYLSSVTLSHQVWMVVIVQPWKKAHTSCGRESLQLFTGTLVCHFLFQISKMPLNVKTFWHIQACLLFFSLLLYH